MGLGRHCEGGSCCGLGVQVAVRQVKGKKCTFIMLPRINRSVGGGIANGEVERPTRMLHHCRGGLRGSTDSKDSNV